MFSDDSRLYGGYASFSSLTEISNHINTDLKFWLNGFEQTNSLNNNKIKYIIFTNRGSDFNPDIRTRGCPY